MIIHPQGWYVTGRKATTVDDTEAATCYVGYELNRLTSRFSKLVVTYDDVYNVGSKYNSSFRTTGYSNDSSNSQLIKTHLIFDAFTGYENCAFIYMLDAVGSKTMTYVSLGYTGCSRSISNGVVTEDALFLLPPNGYFAWTNYCRLYSDHKAYSTSQMSYTSFTMSIYSE